MADATDLQFFVSDLFQFSQIGCFTGLVAVVVVAALLLLQYNEKKVSTDRHHKLVFQKLDGVSEMG